MGHGRKAKPSFKHCLINLVLLRFAYFHNPNLGTGNCFWLLPWPVPLLAWLLATLIVHPSWIVFSCCCLQRTHDPQERNWLQSKGHWKLRPTLRTVLSCGLHSTAVSPGEFKHSVRTFQHASSSVSCLLIIKSSLRGMDTLFKATRNQCMCKRKTVVRNVCVGKESRREGEKGNRNRQNQRHMSVRLSSCFASCLCCPSCPHPEVFSQEEQPWRGFQPASPERSPSTRVGGPSAAFGVSFWF